MKPKHFGLIVLLAVILGIGFWWFTRATVVTPEKAAATPQAPTPTQTAAVKLVTQATEVEAPKLPPINAATASADAQTDLKTAIADIASLYRTNDLAAFWEKYSPPDQLTAALKDFQEHQQEEAEANQKLNETIEYPESQRLIQQIQNQQQERQEAAAKSWAALETQTPVYNAASDEATYVFEIPVSASAVQASGLNWHPQTENMVFIKINGKWYLKGEHSE